MKKRMPGLRAVATARLGLRVTKSLKDAAKKRAKARGIPHTRFVRAAMENALATPLGAARRKAGGD